MLASSTISQSMSSGLSLLCLNVVKSAFGPSNECNVFARNFSPRTLKPLNDSVMRPAALPVGAARAMRNSGLRLKATFTAHVIVNVLPVPGPPVRME